MSILNITETGFDDDSIEEYEYFEYLPIVGAVNNLNNNGGDIAINIETQDIFMHPSESYLLIEGELIKNDGTRYAGADNVALTNNGLIYLFNNIRYDLSGKEIERISHPGQATTMLGFLKYPDDFSKSWGLNQLWYKDTNTTVANNDGWTARKTLLINDDVDNNFKGKFSFRVPLKYFFGFCEDYDKVLYGMKQTLYLTRGNDNNAIFRDGAADVGKVTLTKIAWYMPHVLPADKYKMELYTSRIKKVFRLIIECCNAILLRLLKQDHLPGGSPLKHRPSFRVILLSLFRPRKKMTKTKNPAIFDNVKVTNIHVTLNSYKYPRTDYNLSFPQQRHKKYYNNLRLL